MEHTELTDLPEYWQRHIGQLRRDRAKLREGLVPEGMKSAAQIEISRLRRHDSKMRLQRNEARVELAAVRAELEALRRG